jgi:hypothetical protein
MAGFSSSIFAEGSGPDMAIYSTFAGYGFLVLLVLFFIFFFYFSIHHVEKPKSISPVIAEATAGTEINVDSALFPAFNMAFYSVVLLATVQFLFIVLLIS